MARSSGARGTGPTGVVRLDLKVVPRARRSYIDGVRDGRVIVRVTAPPVGGAANQAVVETLAEALDIPKRCVQIVAGASSRLKTVEISATDPAAVAARLNLPLR